VSRTLVFDAPRHTRAFFESLLVDNLDIGRPEEMQIVFGRRVRNDPAGGYRTRLLRHGDQVTINAYFRHSRVKSLPQAGSGVSGPKPSSTTRAISGWPAAWSTWTNCSPAGVT
jgi:hypothetical protein